MQTKNSDSQFKVEDASSYDDLADEFEFFTNRFSPVLAQRMVALSDIKAGQSALDIGAGTGVVSLEAARALRGKGTVHGIDLSEGMLAIARERTEAAHLADSLTFSSMDAEALDLSDESFDLVLSLYALLHFPNPDVALKEMLRVLKPGGKVVLGVGSGPPMTSLEGVRHRIGRLIELPLVWSKRILLAPNFLDSLVLKHLPKTTNNEESSLAKGHKNRSAIVPSLVSNAGFVEVSTSWRGYRAELESAELFWKLQSTFSSISRKRLNETSDDTRKRIKDEFMKRAQATIDRGGKLVYYFAALYVVAQRPPE